MKLHPLGGLCNRLNAIFSYRSVYPELTIEWADLHQVGGTQWDEVFEPIPGLTFVTGPDLPSIPDGGELELGPDFVANNHPCKTANPNWPTTLKLLKLLPEHQETLGKLMPREPYSAIHVRRTDFKKQTWAPQTTDDEFLRWIRDVSRGPVYVATDNGTTQIEYLTRIVDMGREGIVLTGIREHADQDKHDHRNTGLSHAAIDLFMCAGSTLFMGTRGSSFSTMIGLLHNLNYWWLT